MLSVLLQPSSSSSSPPSSGAAAAGRGGVNLELWQQHAQLERRRPVREIGPELLQAWGGAMINMSAAFFK
eukprot:4778872-Pyramimonas_sp.AAC.1